MNTGVITAPFAYFIIKIQFSVGTGLYKKRTIEKVTKI